MNSDFESRELLNSPKKNFFKEYALPGKYKNTNFQVFLFSFQIDRAAMTSVFVAMQFLKKKKKNLHMNFCTEPVRVSSLLICSSLSARAKLKTYFRKRRVLL